MSNLLGPWKFVFCVYWEILDLFLTLASILNGSGDSWFEHSWSSVLRILISCVCWLQYCMLNDQQQTSSVSHQYNSGCPILFLKSGSSLIMIYRQRGQWGARSGALRRRTMSPTPHKPANAGIGSGEARERRCGAPHGWMVHHTMLISRCGSETSKTTHIVRPVGQRGRNVAEIYFRTVQFVS